MLRSYTFFYDLSFLRYLQKNEKASKFGSSIFSGRMDFKTMGFLSYTSFTYSPKFSANPSIFTSLTSWKLKIKNNKTKNKKKT